MLYGDPTFRYVNPLLPLKKNEELEDAVQDAVPILTGELRGGEGVTVFPAKQRKWAAIGSAIFLVTLLTLFVLSTGNHPAPPQIPSETTEAAREVLKEEKTKRIDALVASLIKDHQEGKTGGGHPGENIRDSRPITLAFLNIKAKGIPEEEKIFMLAKVAETLGNSRGIAVVDREILDKLLEELKLSASNLADSATALRVGRILSARLIVTGSIVRDGSAWQVSLRMIETETTLIKAALAKTIKSKDALAVSEDLAQAILKRIKAAYPSQGVLLSLEEGQGHEEMHK